MTYKPRLHHFARLLVSVAVGLSFTGCGNSSNGGSTGPTFEQVPLISDNCGVVKIGVSSSDSNDFSLLLELFKDENRCKITLDKVNSGRADEKYNGAWLVTQLSDNTYRIQLSSLSPDAGNSGSCTMTCGLLTLTIPENELEYYRRGDEIHDATLEGSFTHTADSCPSGAGAGGSKIKLTYIYQGG